MSKFAIIMKQVGYGCDHTIGCGIRVEHLEADNRVDAAVEAERVIFEWHHSLNEELESYDLVEFLPKAAP